MLVTRQNRIPFIWVVMTMLPWAFWYFQLTVNGVNFFILNRLIDNPAALTFVLSLPGLLFTFLPLGSFIIFKSDRIWTRWGRRKPFIIIGFTGWVIVLTLYPLAPNIWAFFALTFVFAFASQFNSPLEALKMETIPPPMRGRSAALWSWITTVLTTTFWAVVIGRLDEVLPLGGVHLTGDKILYWSAAGTSLIALFIYIFGIHEVNPRSTLTGEKFGFKKLFQALSMKELRYLYLLMFATSMLGAGLGPLSFLLYTEQWGYSTQEMGFNIAVGGVINLFLIPLVGIFADKGSRNRMRIYLACLGAILLLNVVYFTYITLYLPTQRPSLVEIIFFGETTCIFGIIAGVVYLPLVYDYIPRNLMGTYFAGAGILGSIIGFLTMSGLGLFMLGWANLFQPPAGEMARVCVDRDTHRAQIEQTLRAAHLKDPAGNAVPDRDIVAKAWYGDGIVSESGICFEVRLRDAIGRDLLKEKNALDAKIGELDNKVKFKRSEGARAEHLASLERDLTEKRAAGEKLSAELKARSQAWETEVVRGLGARVFRPGSEILATNIGQAATALLPTLRKAKDFEVERLNRQLRKNDPDMVGLRVVRRERGFALAMGARLPPGGDPRQVMQELARHVSTLAAKQARGLIAPGADAALAEAVVKPMASMDVALVEVAVQDFVSAISRVVNAVLSVFTEVLPPDQKLHSLARNLYLDPASGMALARVDPLPEKRKGVRVSVIAEKASVADLATWFGQIRDLLAKKGADVRLTVPVPVVARDVVPIRYNYLAGYVWVFALVSIGFMLIAYFIREEKRGKIHKLGAMEAHAESQALAQREQDGAAAGRNHAAEEQGNATPGRATYTPGYLAPKVLFALLGLGLLAFATKHALPDLRLLAKGARSEAVAVAVVAQKPGQPEERFTTQNELATKMDAVRKIKDYGWVFWNEFSFEIPDGGEVAFRRNVGCKLKPSMPLLDDTGLPTTARVLYDPKNPSRACLPLEHSTWFAPFIIGILGFCACFVGAMLAFFARKPIVLSGDAAVNPEASGRKPA